jgi:pimeloyl-ACP methyl ester carboxylesterase
VTKKKIIIPIAIALLVIIAYYPPLPSPPFSEIYEKVDVTIVTALESFRKTYPPQQIDVNGATWSYLVTGEGDHTILFLHGMTGSYDIWWQQIENLRDRFRIVTLTYPPVNSLQELSNGVIKILDTAQIEKVNLVGSSLGGYFAQYLVANYPARIERAVFANTFPPNTLIAEKNQTLGRLLPLMPEWIVMSFLRKSTENDIYPAAGHSELVKAFLLEQSYGMMTKDQFVARYHCVIDFYQAPDPDALGIKVMIIEADNDPLVEKSLRDQLKQTYPSATVQTLHQLGHFPYLNQPELYTDLLLQFFE